MSEPVRTSQKTYLGDGVYADHDGEHIVLTVDYGLGATETIYLTPDVYGQLVKFANAIRIHPPSP